jgi:tetratricopeptide (TPR) repeat protein
VEFARKTLLDRLPTHLLQNPDDARAHIIYALMLADSNRKGEALQECDQAIELSPGDPVMLYNCTCFYSRLGEIDRALGALRQAIAAGYSNVEWAKQDPDLNPLRDNPDFQTLMEGLRRNRKAELPAN